MPATCHCLSLLACIFHDSYRGNPGLASCRLRVLHSIQVFTGYPLVLLQTHPSFQTVDTFELICNAGRSASWSGSLRPASGLRTRRRQKLRRPPRRRQRRPRLQRRQQHSANYGRRRRRCSRRSAHASVPSAQPVVRFCSWLLLPRHLQDNCLNHYCS